jgi:hypothetical protein
MAGEVAEESAGRHRGELLVVTDQPHANAALERECHDRSEVRRCRELSAECDRSVQLRLARMVTVPEQRHHLFSVTTTRSEQQPLQAATDPPAGDPPRSA